MAARAAHLGADHPARPIIDQFDGVRRDGLGEARPAAARVVLCAAIEEQVAAGGAVVEAVFVCVHVLTGERTLGRSLAQDGILLRREPLAPLLVGAGQLVSRGTHAESDRAAYASTTQATVSVGNFVEILLMIALGIVERASRRNLRGDRAIASTPKRLLVGVAGLLSGPALLVA